MSIQEEPGGQIVLPSIRLSSNKSFGYSYDSLFQTALTFEESRQISKFSRMLLCLTCTTDSNTS